MLQNQFSQRVFSRDTVYENFKLVFPTISEIFDKNTHSGKRFSENSLTGKCFWGKVPPSGKCFLEHSPSGKYLWKNVPPAESIGTLAIFIHNYLQDVIIYFQIKKSSFSAATTDTK